MGSLSAALNGLNINELGGNNGVYLSYSGQAGWSVVRFNPYCAFIQKIFRYLGFYPSTRLDTIGWQLMHEAEVPQPLLAKISDSWARKQGLMAPHSYQDIYTPYREQIGTTGVQIENGDITQLAVQAIVNAANESCLGGGGVDQAVHAAAGPSLLTECRALPEIRTGVRCETGGATVTNSHNLSARGVMKIIHAVGPRYDRDQPLESARLLKSAYASSLAKAEQEGLRTLAFPAISAGIFGYPFDEAMQIAFMTVKEYVMDHPGSFDEIKFVFPVAATCRQAEGNWHQINQEASHLLRS